MRVYERQIRHSLRSNNNKPLLEIYTKYYPVPYSSYYVKI